MAKHKVFVSYHHKDQTQVDQFIKKFSDQADIFITRGLGIEMNDDVIESTDVDYIMQQIRERYIKDSTVTIVLIGSDTWSRRYVDWEIQSSLRYQENGASTDPLPNGLLGIRLGEGYRLPPRLKDNLGQGGQGQSYVKIYDYPESASELAGWIDEAFNSRVDRRHLIVNPRGGFRYNKQP